jgi:SAM-dependent methyltransferase
VAASRAKNAKLIEEGRVAIQQASVPRLPFAENRFDLATAVETQCYWPDLLKDMQEILRVMKLGGALVIIAERELSDPKTASGRKSTLTWAKKTLGDIQNKARE